jgi:hypothetical protein
VGAEQDRRVVLVAELADELLDVLFDRGSSPVVGSSSSSSTGEVRKARAMATFCCMPRDSSSNGLSILLRSMPSRSSVSTVSRRTSAPVRP